MPDLEEAPLTPHGAPVHPFTSGHPCTPQGAPLSSGNISLHPRTTHTSVSTPLCTPQGIPHLKEHTPFTSDHPTLQGTLLIHPPPPQPSPSAASRPPRTCCEGSSTCRARAAEPGGNAAGPAAEVILTEGPRSTPLRPPGAQGLMAAATPSRPPATEPYYRSAGGWARHRLPHAHWSSRRRGGSPPAFSSHDWLNLTSINAPLRWPCQTAGTRAGVD